ncbi:MAG: amino acid ABC transporter substrate-binding protein [Myxococcaceae bacterium]|nr:MAG: amino acid ABC transporter substrate-binding protein [Myxococcaceae bacterium]
MPGSRPPRPPIDRRQVALSVLLGWACACASARPPGRAALALGDSVADDAAIRAAERTLVEGDLPRSRELWSALERAHPSEPTGRYATLRLARIELTAPGDAAVAAARARLETLPRSLEATLSLRRSLVSALVTARLGRPDASLASALATLRGRYVDAQDVVEADCAQAALSPRAASALQALSHVEAAVDRGVRWIPTGLACDEPAARTRQFQDLLPAVEEPGEVAAVLDALPSGHAWRTALARRLRTVAEARGEVRRWMSHLADLPDDEAALRPVVRDSGDPVLRIGVLAPLSGSVANVGAEVVRSVQQAVEGFSRIELMLEDESRALPRRAAVGEVAVTPIEALVRSLRERGVVAIVGPALDANVPGAVAAAQSQGVPLWVPTPAGAVQGTTRALGPTLQERAEAMALAAREQGTRAVLHLPTLPPDAALDGALRAAMARHGVTVVRAGDGGARHVVAGFFDEESQRRWAAEARRSAGRWVLDARAAIAGTPGRWVGLGPADGYGVFASVSCSRADRAPMEISALYYDGVIEAVHSQRPAALFTVLRRDAGVVREGVASAAECALSSSVR